MTTIRDLLNACDRELYLSVREVAVALRISEKSGYRRCREGQWPARKEGHLWRVHRSVLAMPRRTPDSMGQNRPS